MARQKSDSFKRTVKFYDSNFDLVSKTAEGKIVAYDSYEDALAAFGNDTSKVLDALNEALRTKQINAAMAELSGGMEERYIMAFIRPMRSIAPFDKIEKESKQTAAILAQVKTVPFLLDGLKSYCQNRAAEGDDNDDNDE